MVAVEKEIETHVHIPGLDNTESKREHDSNGKQETRNIEIERKYHRKVLVNDSASALPKSRISSCFFSVCGIIFHSFFL